jgi:hypothetical protein
MKRLACAFISVIATTLIGMGYLAVFSDEIDAQNPVNAGAGPFASMYRHLAEYCIIIATTWPVIALGFYQCFGNQYENAVMRYACQRLYPLHTVSGAILIGGLAVAIVIGQPLQWRDMITIALGLGGLAAGTVEFSWSRYAFAKPER